MSGLTQWPTAPEFFAGMKKHFGIDRGANKFLDAYMSAFTKKPSLDVIAFDDWLHKKHGNYEDQGLSMHTLIAKEYGEPAAAFAVSLIGATV